MTVWIVIENCTIGHVTWEDISGVFTSEEAADAWIEKQRYPNKFEAVSWEVEG